MYVCLSVCPLAYLSKKLGHRKGTARHAMPVEALSIAAQLYEKSRLKKACKGK